MRDYQNDATYVARMVRAKAASYGLDAHSQAAFAAAKVAYMKGALDYCMKEGLAVTAASAGKE